MEKKKPVCKLIGQDGNIFNLLGIASRTLKRAGMREEAEKMGKEALNTTSYDEALSVIMKYVEVE